MAQIYFDDDADLGIIQSRRVAVLGYGSAAQTYALNLRDSGVNVVVGLRETSRAGAKAREQGFAVAPVAMAVSQADVVMVMIPQSVQVQIYATQIAPYLAPHAALIFADSFNIRYGYVRPAPGHDVGLVVPKGSVHELREAYAAGQGIPGIVAVQQDATGTAWELVKSCAAGIGLTRAGVIRTTFVEACDTEMFGEQGVLGGGLRCLIQSGFETLVAAGYQPEMAYLEVCQRLQQVAECIGESGFGGRLASIPETAEYGDYVSGPRVIEPETKNRLREVLGEIQNGVFAAKFITDQNAGFPELKQQRADMGNQQIEKIGTEVRRLFPGIAR